MFNQNYFVLILVRINLKTCLEIAGPIMIVLLLAHVHMNHQIEDIVIIVACYLESR